MQRMSYAGASFFAATLLATVPGNATEPAYQWPHRGHENPNIESIVHLDDPRVVEGTATPVTGGILAIDGELFRLLLIKDMNKTGGYCLLKGGDVFDASRRSVYATTAEQDAECGRWATAHAGEPNRNKRIMMFQEIPNYCYMRYTALDQRDALAKIIDGRTVRCEAMHDDELEPIWKAGKFISSFGQRTRPARCTVDGESLSLLMTRSGWASKETHKYVTFKRSALVDLKPINAAREALRTELKAGKHAHLQGMSCLKHAVKPYMRENRHHYITEWP